jgi:hypothetical protein
MSEAWELGAKQSHGIDQMQTHWTCYSKGIDQSTSSHGTHCGAVEQINQRTLKVNPQ